VELKSSSRQRTTRDAWRPTRSGNARRVSTCTTASASAKVPGTVVRVETDNGGVYEAHIRKADGTEVEVKVDKDFKVTATETHTHP
jgi:hypothetical protein